MSVPMKSLDPIAESYVLLTLALGEIDPYHVDAYYGPAEWKEEAKHIGLLEIIEQASEARLKISDRQANENPRARYLAKQLDALIAVAERHKGVTRRFDEESAAIFDVVAPSHPDSYYQAIIDELDPHLPGTGTLSDRWETCRSQFYIPADKLERIFAAAVDAARERTKKYISLPADESFDIELVSGQVWGAYNWYKGRSHSLIQVNTDLPMVINRVVHLACHEGYPGHHVYNALLEQHMVRENHWMEFTVNPLYGPMSLIAEGTAEYGVQLCFPKEDRLVLEHDVLYPMAGLDPARAGELLHITELMDKLGNASNDAARRYLDGKASREQTVEWLQTYALVNPKRAEQNVRFFEAHRTYTVTYDVGEEVVRRYVEAKAKTTDEKWKVFTALLNAPVVPSDLLLHAATA